MSILLLATDQTATISTIDSLFRSTFFELSVTVAVPAGDDLAAWTNGKLKPVARQVSWLRVTSDGELSTSRDWLSTITTPYVMILRGGEQLNQQFIKRAIASHKTEGWDFIAGTVAVKRGNQFVASLWPADTNGRVYDTDAIDQNPEFLADTQLGNKLFSTHFMTRLLASLSPQTLLQMRELSELAYAHADSFDRLDVPALRIPAPTGIRSLGRVWLCEQEFMQRVVGSTAELSTALSEKLTGATYTAWLTRKIGMGLFPFFEVVPRVDAGYWEILQDSVASMAGPTNIQWTLLPIHQRLLLWSMITNNRDDVETISISRSDYSSSFAVNEIAGELLCQPEYLERLQITQSDELLRFSPADHRVVAKLTSFSWRDDGSVDISGYAYVKGLDPALGSSKLSASAVAPDGISEQAIQITAVRDETIDWTANDNWTSYAESGFQFTVQPRELFANLDFADVTRWSLKLVLTVYGQEFTDFTVLRDTVGAGGLVPIGPMVADERLALEHTSAGGLTLVRVKHHLVAKQLRTGNDRNITLDITTTSPELFRLKPVFVAECTRAGKRLRQTLEFDAQGHAVVNLTLPSMPAATRDFDPQLWDLAVRRNDGQLIPIAYAAGTYEIARESDPSARLHFEQTGHGFLKMSETKSLILADSVSLVDSEKALRITGTWSSGASPEPQLVLHSSKGTIRPESMEIVHTSSTSGTFVVSFPLTHDDWSTGTVYKESGAYSLRLVADKDGSVSSNWIGATVTLQQTMPRRIHGQNVEIGVSRTSSTAALVIHMRPALRPDEIGRYNQQQLRAGQNHSSLKANTALFMCFGGKRATDSPRRIFESLHHMEPAPTIRWAVVDGSVPVPDGAIKTVIGSAEWFEALATSELLVNNNNFPFYFRKRKGQTYIQTWHGTPLKRLGNDVARTNFSLSYWNLMWREAGYWDTLLAQNDYAAKTLATCFGFEGRVVKQGYPRNDSLRSPEAALIRERTRQHLGIPHGKKVLLYTPTWRDDKRTNNDYQLVTYLDFARVQELLGDDYVILLRGHHNVSGQRQTAGNNFIIDATEYPEVNDLYLAADILINDYSSVMFDFCVTRKPIIYLTPDIVQYRDSTRGFYFDLESLAPGPLLTTTEEVIEAIVNVESVQDRYKKRYNNFVDMFAPNCDGQATQRTVQELSEFLEFFSKFYKEK
ncbi:hypothetical protein ART_1250 [Arthrobacter sp. PAMC 25486]|nr:hypothetical protein ART_1250 [Arthrobacter sp. PAMC 25486]